jgi:regulator of replication initiation timing
MTSDGMSEYGDWEQVPQWVMDQLRSMKDSLREKSQEADFLRDEVETLRNRLRHAVYERDPMGEDPLVLGQVIMIE